MNNRWVFGLLLAAVVAMADARSAEAPRAAAPSAITSASAPLADKPTPNTSVAGNRTAADRLDLDVSVVTGNRELPKVLYIVPWKKAELGDLPEQPFNSLLDEVLKPLDRDEFRREVAYFSKLSDRPAASGATRDEKSAIAPTTSR